MGLVIRKYLNSAGGLDTHKLVDED
jgi:hypothetical protein